MNKKIYLILAVLTIISVLFCLNACSAVEDNNNVSIVSDSIDISADSDLNTQVSSDSVKISQDEVNKELDIKPKYKCRIDPLVPAIIVQNPILENNKHEKIN